VVFLEIPRKQLAGDSVIVVFVKTFNSESKCASVHAFLGAGTLPYVALVKGSWKNIFYRSHVFLSRSVKGNNIKQCEILGS
jgi:hypothetical protein